jgi:hypothetical protein
MRRAVLALSILVGLVFVAGGSPLTPVRQVKGGGACGLPLVMGDLSGNRAVWANDALYVLRVSAGLFVPGPPCSPVDVDCSGQGNSLDALKILRYAAGLDPGAQSEPCVDIGSEIPP